MLKNRNKVSAADRIASMSLSRLFAAAAAVMLIMTGVLSLSFSTVWAKGTDTNYTQINNTVAKGARAKYTKLKGKGRDTVTLMIYMIGTDLESQNGMATSDLNEMLYSEIDNSRVNILIETGGCRRWRNSVISAGKLQRWKLTGRGLQLDDTMKSQAMTNEQALADFIQYAKKTAPADRYMLIFWDHGGGSVSGYGYDEVYPNDSMDVGEIASALKKGGLKFDFIGFDACLMATLETAVAVEPYADYMIASEEAEPGTGWYYTNWLKLLDNNSSTNTLELGRQILDDFTMASARSNSRSQTTLSLIDLSELDNSVLRSLTSFGKGLTKQLKSKDFQSVATARNGSREFARSNHLDQIDLVDFCNRLGTDEGAALAKAIRSAVKYNRVNNMTDAYGLSIYFPNSSLKSMNSMIQIYENIGMDDEWSESIRTYATLESSGQIAASSGAAYGSGSGSLLDILLGLSGGSYDSGYGSGNSAGSGQSFGSSTGSGYDPYGGYSNVYGSSYDSYGSMTMEDMLNLLTGSSSWGGYGNGNTSSWGGGSSSSSGGLTDSLLSLLLGGYTSTDGMNYGGTNYSSILGGSSDYVSTDLLSLAAQLLCGRAMVGSETLALTDKDGVQVLQMDEDRWDQVVSAELEVFIDDGNGYLDLGLDNVFEFDDDGDMIVDWDGTWLTLEGQPVAVYPISDEDADEDGLWITRKYIPALLEGERVNLIVEFNEETGEDKVLGAQSVLDTGVVGKGYIEMEAGDEIKLLCDYFTYDGNFESQYVLGKPVTVPEDGVLTIGNMELTASSDYQMLYTGRLTDIYQAHYWLPVTKVS